MRPYTTAHLSVLATAYCDGTGTSLSALGESVAGNGKLFRRLRDGMGCTAGNAERASLWFAENWPENVPWPAEGPAPVCDTEPEAAA